MSNKSAWARGFAIEDEAPVAEFNIEVNPDDFAEDGTMIDPVTDEGEAPLEVLQTEMVETEGEIAETEDTIEDLEQTAEAFESARIAVEAAIHHRGGMTPTEIALLRMGLENRAFHNSAVAQAMPSPEHASSNRIAASTEALDSIKQGIQDIWEKIKEQIRKLYAKLKNWWLKTFDAAPRLRKKAEAIQKKAEKNSGSPKDKKIDLPLGKALADADGKVSADGSTMLKNVAAVEALVTNWLGTANQYEDLIDSAESEVAGLIALAKQLADDRDGARLVSAIETNKAGKAAKAQADKVKSITNIGGSTPRANYFDNKEYNFTPVDLMGGKSLYQMYGAVVNGKVENASELRKIIVSLAPRFENTYKKPKDIDNTQSFPVLSTSEISSVCDHAITVANVIEAYRKKWDKREKARAAVEKEVDRAIKEFKDGDDLKNDAGGRSLVIEGVKGFTTLVNTILTTEQKISSYAISTMGSCLTYCNRSLANHKN